MYAVAVWKLYTAIHILGILANSASSFSKDKLLGR